MAHLAPQRTIETILRNLPLTTVESIQDAQQICDHTGFHIHPDVRMQVWDITVESIEPIQLSGYVSSSHSLYGLNYIFNQLGHECLVSDVIAFPDPSCPDYPFGMVTTIECPLFSDKALREQVDSALLGDPLYLLLRDESMSLVYSSSGYAGWTHNHDFKLMTEDEWLDWMKHDHAQFITPFELQGITIPGGAELMLTPTNEVCLPTGSHFIPISGMYIRVSSNNSQQRRALREVALTKLKVPYHWGGMTSRGIDCSGLIRYAYQCIGVYLPRDTDQQFLCGKIIGLPWCTGAITTGDLLFFSGEYGGITHVGMALSNEEFIHASQSDGVCRSSLKANNELRERFVCAKRIIR